MAGICLHSQPKAVGGLTFKSDKVLAEMISELGAASLLVYFKVIEWDWDPDDEVGRYRETRLLCPRCRTFNYWALEWGGELVERLRHVTDRLHSGQMDIDDALDELSEQVRRDEGAGVFDDDLLFSRQLRAIVKLLRKSVGPGTEAGLVAVVVPSGLMCSFVWHMLCLLQLVWQRQVQETPSPPEEVLQRLVLQNGGSTLVARLHPSTMKQEDIERVVRDVKGLRTSVLVICADSKMEELPSGLSGLCTHIVCWDNRSSVPLSLCSSTCRQYTLWGDWEYTADLVAPYANTWGDTVHVPYFHDEAVWAGKEWHQLPVLGASDKQPHFVVDSGFESLRVSIFVRAKNWIGPDHRKHCKGSRINR
jgi:hypothetical protein